MSNHTIETEVSQKPRRRTRKVVIMTVALLTVAGVAFAAYLVLAGITGGGTTKTMTAKWSGTPTLVTSGPNAQSMTEPTTAPTVNSTNGTLALPTGGVTFWPTDTYVFLADVYTQGSAGYVAGITMPGLPTGYKAEIIQGCGVVAGPTATDVVKVGIRITAGDNPPPAAGSWTLSQAGVQMSPTTQAKGTTVSGVSCPAYNGGAA